MSDKEIQDMIEYYRSQGAPQDQQMLIALLHEAQEAEGGLLSLAMLDTIADAYGIKSAVLNAIIRRISRLRCETVPHTLEVCGTCRAGAKLQDFIERTYGVKSGDTCRTAGFSYRVTPCMKNCKNGPSIRWDGELYGRASESLIKSLPENRKK